MARLEVTDEEKSGCRSCTAPCDLPEATTASTALQGVENAALPDGKNAPARHHLFLDPDAQTITRENFFRAPFNRSEYTPEPSDQEEVGVNPKDLVGITKSPLDLVPAPALILAAECLRDGAQKYGPYNWRDYPVQARIYVGAAMRHITAWADGEENAPDSGRHHLAHAIAGLMILLDAQLTGHMKDNRSKTGLVAKLIEEFTEDK